jgi:hypothetical protein
MGMKKSAALMSLLGMAMMSEGMGGMGDPFGSEPDRRRIAPGASASKRTPAYNVSGYDKIETLQAVGEAFALLVAKWNLDCGRKAKDFIVQGFTVKGTSQNSATKRIRKFLATAGLEPNTTKDLLKERLEQLRKPKGIDAGLEAMGKRTVGRGSDND